MPKIVSNVWAMTCGQQVAYWKDSANDANDQEERKNAEQNLGFWCRLSNRFGSDYVVDDLSEVDDAE